MDPHSVSMLERAQALRRSDLSASAGAAVPPHRPARARSCGTAVENRRRLLQTRPCWGLTEKFRCLSSAQVLSEWTTSTSPCNNFPSNGDNPLNFVSHSKGSLQQGHRRGRVAGPGCRRRFVVINGTHLSHRNRPRNLIVAGTWISLLELETTVPLTLVPSRMSTVARWPRPVLWQEERIANARTVERSRFFMERSAPLL